MKRLMVVVIALVVVAAGLWGCTGSPATVVPPYEATPAASQTRGGAELGSGASMPSPTGPGPAATPTRTPPNEEEVMTPQPAQDTPEANCPEEARNVVLIAKDDLARGLGLSVSEISVVSVEAVDWPDTSLGCPEPGKVYAQVITPGYLVVLEAEGQTYEYHTDKGGQVTLCDTDVDTQAPSPKGITDSTPWKPVEPIEPDAISPTPRP
jgi:hypothetical protein